MGLQQRIARKCAPLPDGSVQGMLGTLGQLLEDIANDPGGRAMRVMQGTGRGGSPPIYQGASPPIQ